MSLLKYFTPKPDSVHDRNDVDSGILIFDSTSEVIRAEKVLKQNGWNIRVMGPPPQVRTGCDLVIEFPLMEEMNILRTLDQSGIIPTETAPVSSPLLKPVDIYTIKDFGRHLMVRAANMKITIDKNDLTIVNISGGGCPDVPYLAHEMTGKRLHEAPCPKDIGHTLCAYALQLAYEEVERRCSL
ncbi:MAG TPA: hypothetical protein DDY17_03550 [Syntrophaceae bacterium]|jgi:hypothetical protein|nr:hypothetical protein [Syntrophaceae bacterium]